MAWEPKIVVVDTPGVGALDGDDDREVALAAVRNADLAIWVAANGSTQAETAAALLRVARWGVPMLMVINCREDLSSEEARRQFVTYPQSTFADLDGHLERLMAYLDPHAQRPIGTYPIHGRAASLATQHDPPDPDLLRESRIGDLVEAIVREAHERGTQRRAAAIVDMGRRALVEAGELATALATERELVADSLQQAASDFGRRSGRLIEDVDQYFEVELAALFRQTTSWADRHYRRPDRELERLWAEEEERLLNAADALIQECAGRLRRRLVRINQEVAVAWSKRLAARRGPGPKLDTATLTPRWVEAGGRVIVTSGAGLAGAAIGTFLGGPPGTLIGGAIGTVTGELLGKLVRFRRGQLTRRRKDLHDYASEATRLVREESERQWQVLLTGVRQELAVRHTTQQDLLEATKGLAQQAHLVASAANEAVRRCDVRLVQTWARIEGRDRLASAIDEVVRHPGFACLVPLADRERLDEFLLWPLNEPPEDLRPVPAADGNAEAEGAAYALAIGRRGGFLVPSSSGLDAFLPGVRSDSFAATEGFLVARASDVMVQLLPIVGQSTEPIA
jgi:hypothetical protein